MEIQGQLTQVISGAAASFLIEVVSFEVDIVSRYVNFL